MNIKQLLNHQRHRSKPSSLLLLAILLLSVWASTAGGQDDPNKADVPSAVAAVENKPHSEEFRVGGSTIIVVETSPGDSKTKVIRQIIQTLEKSHLADKKTKYPELPGTGITVRLEILMEETARELSKLVLGLSELNLPDLRISLDRDDKSNKGIISASEDASADALARITDYLTTQKFMSLTVTAPPLKPVNDAVTGKLAAEIEVPTIEVSVFYLKYATAKDIAEKIGQLYPEQEGTVVVDERTNSLLIRGDNATIREYERLLDVLDADDSINPRATKPVGGFGGYSPFGGGGRKSGGDTASTKNQNTSPTGGSMPPEDRSNDTDTEQLKIFSLKNSNVRDAAKIIETLFGFPSVKVATDERTNSLIISGDKADIGAIDEILLQLDSNESAAKNSATKNLPSVDANEPIISIAEYRQRLDALEQPVQQLAKQVRAAEAKLGKDHADSARLRAELRALVQQTFAARQEIQRAELAEFTRRLQRMQRSIDTRDKIVEKIVDRRMEELLDPDASWEKILQSPGHTIEAPSMSGAMLRKQLAQRLITQSRQALEAGNIDLARTCVQQAIEMNASWGLWDDRPQHVFADIEKQTTERPSNPLSVPSNRSELLLTIDGILESLEVFEKRTPLKLLLQFKDEYILQTIDEYLKSVLNLRVIVEGNESASRVLDSFESVEQHSEIFISKFREAKSQQMKVCVHDIEVKMAILKPLTEAYQQAGIITAIDAEKNQVKISLGLSDDLKIGQRLRVASGTEKVGTIEVISVERDNCVGRILDVNPDRQMQNGDRAMILATPKTEEDRQE